MILTLMLVLLVIFVFYKYITWNYDYFERKGINFTKPIPLFGNSGWMFRKISLLDFILENYNKFSGEKLYGIYDFRQPSYYIRDIDLIKQLTIKDFQYFEDHNTFIDLEGDQLLGNTLISLKGRRWREMRSALSPAFTSSKIRLMFELVSNCANQMVQHLSDEYKKSGIKSHDVKEIFGRYTNDVIASCAFGIECNSFKNPNNDFHAVGEVLTEFTKPLQMLKLYFITIFPKLSTRLNLKIISDDVSGIFNDAIIYTMNFREKKGIIRPDMINLLIQLKSGNLKNLDNETNERVLPAKTAWTDNELIAQCFSFFSAGFETSSTLMMYTAYELAVHPGIQKKLLQEIDETQENLTGNLLTYDALQNMKYMDMVISEALRKWPPAPIIERQCSKHYHYVDDDDGFTLDIEKGRSIFVPVYGLHMDPKYFPDPKKFDPDRFSDENKTSLNMSAFMPFGIGPRGCIGSRFALLETKAVIYYLLLKFTFEVCSETQVPLLIKTGPGAGPAKKIMLNLKARNFFENIL